MRGKSKKSLEERVDDLERILNKETNVFPNTLHRFHYLVRKAVLRIMDHLGLEIEYVPPDKCRIVEKIND